MNLDDFKSAIKEKNARTLLDLLRDGQTGKKKVDPDFLGAIIDELYSRNLSPEETKELENILTSATNEVHEENQKKVKGEFTQDEVSNVTGSDKSELVKYPALKAVVGLFYILCLIVGLVGLIGLVFLSANGQVAMGIVALLSSAVIVVPLLAFSNLIYVFLDIEVNTRKTREALEKKKN